MNKKIDHDKILRESITDANTLVETATAYARDMIAESITPQIRGMLTRKLNNESEEDDEFGPEEETPIDVTVEPELDVDMAPEAPVAPGPELPADLPPQVPVDLAPQVPVAPGPELPADVPPSPDVAPEEEEYDDLEEELNAMLSELESEEDETFTYNEEEIPSAEEEEEIEFATDDEDVEFDIQEIIKGLHESDDDDEDDKPEDDEELEEVTKQRDEAFKVIKKLRSTITEVSLLNAKLLYTNKIFSSFNMSDKQKLNVVEVFDRAGNLNEVKLIYATVLSSVEKTASKTRNPIKENFASSVPATQKPKKTILTEGDDAKSRFKILAGLQPNR